LPEERKLSPDQIRQEALNLALKYCKNPENLISLMNTLNSFGRNGTPHAPSPLHVNVEVVPGLITNVLGDEFAYELVVELGPHVLERLKKVEKGREARFPEKYELDLLNQESADLASKNKHLTEEQEQRLKDLQLKTALDHSINSRYVFADPDQTERLKFNVCSLMLQASLHSKKLLEKIIEADPEHTGITPEYIVAEREKRDAQVAHVIEILLANLNDPSHLISAGNELNNSSSLTSNYQTVVRRFAQRVQEIVDRLEAERVERAVWEQRLQDLENEQAELQTTRKNLTEEKEAELRELRMQSVKQSELLPSYKKQQMKQHDKYRLQAVQMIINAILNARDQLEQQIQQDEELPKDQIEEQRKGIAEQLDSAIKNLVLPFLKDPNHLQQIANDLKTRKEHDRVLPVVKDAFTRIRDIIAERKKRLVPEQWIKLLEQEQDQLAVSKKTLAKPEQTKLDECRAQVDAFDDLPSYAEASFEKYVKLMNKLANTVLLNALDAYRQVENKISEEESQMETEEADLNRTIARTRVDAAIEFCLANVDDPTQLLSWVDTLANYDFYDPMLVVGKRCQKRLKDIDVAYNERLAYGRQLHRLQTSQTELRNQRKDLSNADMQQLRELRLRQALDQLQLPRYEQLDPTQTDNYRQQACMKMISAIVRMAKAEEGKMAMDDDLSQSTVDARKAELSQKLADVVVDSIELVDGPRNLYNVAYYLYGQLEYELMIVVGARCQARIEALQQENDRRTELQQQIAELKQKLVVTPSDDLRAELTQKQWQLEDEFPILYESNQRLDSLNLQMANLMIEAAKVEERADVLRDQAVLRFKIQPSMELFEQVKIMTDEKEWDKVKKKLLKDILRPVSEEEAAGQKTINPKDKIQLLLNEGMWKETVAIFPDPGMFGNEAIDLLERLYLEVEKNAPSTVASLLPTIEKYAISLYQTFTFDNPHLERLLDAVQQRNPDFIYGMFTRASEKLLLNILPKQYGDYVEFLKVFKRRLNDELGREDDWDAFISDVTKKNRGKKKLLQMIQHANLKG
jgi:hypothetical protein